MLAFYIINFVAENRHCPVESSCRELISKSTKCHSAALLHHFTSSTDEWEHPIPCYCCYNCIKSHSDNQCLACEDFLSRFLPNASHLKLKKSVAAELQESLLELFTVLGVKKVKVEKVLDVDCDSFIKDLLRIMDEIKSAVDITRLWHVDPKLAQRVFAVIRDVLGTGNMMDDLEICKDSSDDESDSEDSSTCSSSCDESSDLEGLE